MRNFFRAHAASLYLMGLSVLSVLVAGLALIIVPVVVAAPAQAAEHAVLVKHERAASRMHCDLSVNVPMTVRVAEGTAHFTAVAHGTSTCQFSEHFAVVRSGKTVATFAVTDQALRVPVDVYTPKAGDYEVIAVQSPDNDCTILGMPAPLTMHLIAFGISD